MGSMAKMLSRIVEQKEAISLFLSADHSTNNIVPTWHDLNVLQAIDSAISPSQPGVGGIGKYLTTVF